MMIDYLHLALSYASPEDEEEENTSLDLPREVNKTAPPRAKNQERSPEEMLDPQHLSQKQAEVSEERADIARTQPLGFPQKKAKRLAQMDEQKPEISQGNPALQRPVWEDPNVPQFRLQNTALTGAGDIRHSRGVGAKAEAELLENAQKTAENTLKERVFSSNIGRDWLKHKAKEAENTPVLALLQEAKRATQWLDATPQNTPAPALAPMLPQDNSLPQNAQAFDRIIERDARCYDQGFRLL